MKHILSVLVFLLLVPAVLATPANTPVLDGKPLEYDATDMRGTFTNASTWGANGTVTNLYVTWDATYLYVALQGWQQDNNKLVVLVDVDPDAGTGATTTTNWTGNLDDESYISYNDYGWVDGGTFGLDYMLASEGNANNAIRILYDGAAAPTTNTLESLYDSYKSGNNANPAGTPIDMACLNDTTDCLFKGFEARIPWTKLYEGTRWGTVEPGETIPRNASLRILAGIHNNTPNVPWSSPDTIPEQAVVDYTTNGILTTATYLDLPLDVDTNGIPDMLAGDVNAPWIRAASGAVGGTNLLVMFSEPITQASAENTGNWSVGGSAPGSAAVLSSNLVLLGLSSPIASTDLLPVIADGVEDLAANTREVAHCLFPASSGIPQPVTVTFQVNTNSGMGISASHNRPTAFFVNGSSLPLEWGYSGSPPHESTQLTPIPGSNGWTSVSVTFLAGSPSELEYKYSARIDGTNNYEAIRLTDFASVARPLSLNTNGAPMTVVDYLGAAAYPLRNTGDTNEPTAHNRLYQDTRRGDAGVHVRREILFQLDLSLRRQDHLARVMVLGSDPLRGFNDTGSGQESASDYPDNSAFLDWNTAGIELVDDGTLGDVTAGDGVYSRLWAFSTNGIDSAAEPGDPYSLVGGDDFTEPYLGYGWTDRRSPRSMIYKFFVLTSGGNDYQSPSYNIEYYITDPDETAQIVLDPWVWDNDDIPPPPPSNAPAVTAVTLAGDTATVEFENVLTEGAHGVKVAASLMEDFEDYGIRAVMGGTNGDNRVWTASVPEISGIKEFYAPYAGLEPDPTPTYWEPNADIPTGATTVRVYFCQFQSNLSGKRSMNLTGTFSGWDDGLPMTFQGDGVWMIDLALPAATDGEGVKFKPRGGPTLDWFSGNDIKFIRGTGGVTMAPMPPVPGELFTITLDAAGTPAAAWTNVDLHMGFDDWQDVQDSPRPAMTNTAGTTWEYAFEVPTNYSLSIDFVFTDGTDWYSDNDNANWHAFMAPYYNAP